jgi:hypothetical protein
MTRPLANAIPARERKPMKMRAAVFVERVHHALGTILAEALG